MNPVELFNRKLLDFADDLRALKEGMPHLQVPELDVLRPSIKLALTVDETKPRRMFNDYVAAHYEQRILDKDERFFLEQAAFGGGSQESFNLVQVLRRMWTELSPSDRDAIWAHLRVLLLLNAKC